MARDSPVSTRMCRNPVEAITPASFSTSSKVRRFLSIRFAALKPQYAHLFSQ